ncbi:MAG: hypothetical protein OHK0046_14210 [Anaerolineae bacterium]
MPMSKTKFETAKELIQAGDYDKARALLRTIDHPKAEEWLKRLETLEKQKTRTAAPTKPQTAPARPATKPSTASNRPKTTATPPTPKKATRSRLPLILGLVVVLVLVIAGALLLPGLLENDDDTTTSTTVPNTAVAAGPTTDAAATTPEADTEVQVTDAPTEDVTEVDSTTAPTANAEPAADLTEELQAAFEAVEGVLAVNALSAQPGTVDTFGFDYFVNGDLNVAAGLDLLALAETLRVTAYQALNTDEVRVKLTMNESGGTPVNYEWANRGDQWVTTRAYTSETLIDAATSIEGVEYAEAVSISPGTSDSGFDVFVSARFVVARGATGQETADAVLQTILEAYETENVELVLTLTDNASAVMRYEWSNATQAWTVTSG